MNHDKLLNRSTLQNIAYSFDNSDLQSLQSSENFNSLLNSTDDSYILCDGQLKLLACNNAYLRLHKQFSDSSPNKKFDLKKILSPERKKKVLEYINSGLKEKEFKYEVFYQTPVKMWLEVHIYPIKEQDNKTARVCICIKNITEKKAFEREAAVSKIHERSLFQSTSEALMLLNSTNTIISYNNRAVELMKKFVCKEIYTGLKLIKAVPPFRRADLATRLAEVWRGHYVEYEVIYPDNSLLWVSLAPVKNHSGIINEICVSIRDVTARKNMEEELGKINNQYISLVGSLSEGVIMQTFEKSVLTVNNSAAEILQISKNRLMKYGFPFPGISLINKKNECIDLDMIIGVKIKAGESVKGMVTGIQRRKGIQWLFLNIQPVYNGGVLPDAYVVSMTDITAACEYVKELSILSKVVTESSNLITITGIDEKIVWANKTFLKTTGYSLKEVLNKKPGTLLKGPEKNRKEKAKIKAALSKGVPVEGELLNYGKDGKKYWVQYYIHPVKDENGNIIRFFSIQSDISEKLRLQEDLQQAIIKKQQAVLRATLNGQEKERNELGKELHDNINQILAAVRLSLECSLNSMENNRAFVESAFNNVTLAIKEIRGFSHQLVSPHFQQNSFDELVSEVILNMKLSKITDVIIDPDCEKRINADLKLNLFRIVQEQLSNILKHAKATSIQLRLGLQKNKVILKITDNGVGFQKNAKKKGIGIMNIYNRVESFNGTVQIKSSPGMGCILQADIPF